MKFLLLFVLALLIGGGVFYFVKIKSQPAAPATFTEVEIRGGKIIAEVADTKAKRERGLSGREVLEPGYGMLLVFEEPGKHSIWMKDMQHGLDLVWIGNDNKVVDFKLDVMPCASGKCASNTPATDAKYVLELPTGTLSSFGVVAGDSVKIAN